jgi:hypothetical protein
MKEPQLRTNLTKREKEILEFIFSMNFDGSHHKQWQLDQIARKLTGLDYDAYVKYMNYGEEGENTYEWDCGIAP